MGRLRSESQSLQPPACLSRTASSPSPSSDTNFSPTPWTPLIIPRPTTTSDHAMFLSPTTATNAADKTDSSKSAAQYHNLDLQLSTTSRNPLEVSASPKRDDDYSTQLQLSIGSSDVSDKNESNITYTNKDHAGKSSPGESNNSPKPEMGASRLKEQAREQLKMAMAEKIYAEEARKQAKRQIEMAEQEFSNAKRIRQQAQAELGKAQVLRQHAIKQIESTILQITCHACKQKFHARTPTDENSLVFSYMSSSITEGEVEHSNGIGLAKTSNR